MKTITFRPLRKVKSLNKIVVASYSQWSRLMTADYGKFNLIIDNEYRLMDSEAYVYNHKGEQLFFYDYNPADVPVYTWTKELNFSALHNAKDPYAIQWGPKGHANYNMPGTDCQGVPTFSHWTAYDVAEFIKINDVNKFEPLTVRTVVHWFGWILYRLNNCNLSFLPRDI